MRVSIAVMMVAVLAVMPVFVAVSVVIVMAVIVVLVRIAVPGELARRHALRGHHGLARKARGLRQLGQPGLEIQAVHEQHLRGGQLLRVARS
ncbi:hypothetical protein G6F50_018345 [Rhizopus delemar]|uniref:Uncharacterized protein n=1 Tax=Rhizopus delemar TaxID=936053 RepID=A0A9P7BZH5_9FUNG|nr:hypothetical protein G6F50_018345 [Rhizopus delemar]